MASNRLRMRLDYFQSLPEAVASLPKAVNRFQSLPKAIGHNPTPSGSEFIASSRFQSLLEGIGLLLVASNCFRERLHRFK